jgi:hypothetical protein
MSAQQRRTPRRPELSQHFLRSGALASRLAAQTRISSSSRHLPPARGLVDHELGVYEGDPIAGSESSLGNVFTIPLRPSGGAEILDDPFGTRPADGRVSTRHGGIPELL